VNHHLRSAQVWHVFFEGSHSLTCTPTPSSAIRTSHTRLCLPSYVAGTHLPTPDGLKAELAWVAGLRVLRDLFEKSRVYVLRD